MAKKKRCKECEGMGKDCKCPPKAKGGRLGYYGLEHDDSDDKHMGTDDMVGDGNSDGGGSMGESVKMPKEPGHKQLDGLSSRHKKKKLDDFKAHADEAKKRQRDLDRKGELAKERRTKGIRFYDAKGSGYIKDGKKQYD